MILQELVKYYDRKAVSGDDGMAPEGWLRRGVDYVVVVTDKGDCVNFEAVFTKIQNRAVGLEMLLPTIGKQALKHSNSGKDANLLWDNASFVFGRGNKGALKAESFSMVIEEWMGDCDDIGISAVKTFIAETRSDSNFTIQLLTRFGVMEDFETRDPIIAFRLHNDDSSYVHDRPSVRETYERARARSVTDAVTGTCLVTGRERAPIARNETVIKGVWDAQPAGANIVSFNDRAFESYGKRERQGENAPISQYASFAYTTALNHLLRKDSAQRLQVGDASAVFWADKSTEFETGVVDIFGEPTKDDPDRNTRAVASLYKAIDQGLLENDEGKVKFFALGLAPNAARIAIRFWHHSTVADMAQRIRQHFDDLAIERAPHDPPYLSLFRLLVSVATLGKADNIPPNLGGELMRSVLADLPYPQTLLAAAVRRIRAEQAKKDDRTGKQSPNVTYPRAALIKACINRSTRYSNPNMKEEMKMSLDESNPNTGYRLGRLFAVLEKIQQEASRGINATIRDRYYGAASATPVAVFSTLLKLKNHHLSKLENRGRAVNLEKLVGEIMDGINDFPAQLPLADQGRFAIGYYHQRQVFFKKHDTSNEGA